MVDVISETVIERPVSAVAAYAGDLANAPAWLGGVRSARWASTPPFAAGARINVETQVLRRRRHRTAEVVEVVNGGRLVVRLVDDRVPVESTWTWSVTPDGHTRMRLRTRRPTPPWPRRMATPVTTLLAGRRQGRDLATLKRLLESRS